MLASIGRHFKTAKQSARDQAKEPTSPRRTGVELEFMPDYLEVLERPPSKVARFFAVGIVVICSTVLLWAIVFELDMIASARGRIVVFQQTKTVQAQDQGEVRRIAVRNGQVVQRGDVLLELNPITAKAEAERISAQRALSALEVRRLGALLSDDPSGQVISEPGADEAQLRQAREYLLSDYSERLARLRALESRIAENLAKRTAAQRNIAETRTLLVNVRQRFEIRDNLSKKELGSKIQTLELQRELLERERELTQQEAAIELLDAEADTIRNEGARQETEWRRTLMTRLYEERKKLTDLEQEFIKVGEQSRRQTITAPESGVVQQLAVTTLGSVVKVGQDVLVIVPDRDEFEADVNLLNKDVGFVRSGQVVELKIDSFPYTKFGTVKAEVVNVSIDAVKDEELGPVYPAKLKLQSQAMIVDGHPVRLTAGMAVTAEINTGTRRVIDYVLSPVQAYANEALRER